MQTSCLYMPVGMVIRPQDVARPASSFALHLTRRQPPPRQATSTNAKAAFRTTGRSHRLVCRAAPAVRENATGVEFPEVTSFWAGETFRCLGAGHRAKRIAFVGVKIYAIALYVEAAKAARELGIRDRGGFFKDASDEDYVTAIVDGAFDKLLQVHLVRNIEGTQFYEALEKHLAPRLRLTGGMDSLQKFGDFINSQSLQKGTDVLMLWRDGDNLDVGVKPPGSAELSEGAEGILRLQSVPLCRGLFEVFLGSDSIVPEAKKSWAQGAQTLLASERVQKDTRPGGFG